ncbi:MAG: CHAT domain-containing protein [Candidatus Aminicenantes bacterium]|nr:CHAT domain-containing protein [Candidatus Aminicenantes bacterium]
MIGRKGLRIVFILFFVLGAAVFSQDKQGIEDKDKGLREEILAVYQSKGEQGLRDFFKERGKEITGKFIVDFAEAGVKERKEEWLKACEIMAEEKKDEKTLADALYILERYFRKINDYKKASNYLDKALKIYLKLKDLVGRGNVYFSQGEIYLISGKFSDADDMYDKALQLFQKKGEKKGQGNVFRGKGDIDLRTGNYSKAIDMYDKALIFFDKEKDLQEQGIVYLKKGGIYRYIGENSKGLEMLDKALFLFEKIGDADGKGRGYLNKGDIYFYSGDISKAIEMYDTALTLFLTLNNSIGAGNIYLRKGSIFEQKNEYSKAFEFYDKALYYFELSDYLVGKGEVYKSKGGIYLYMGNYPRALEMFDKAFYFFDITNNPIGKGDIYKNKGNMYLYTCDYVKALEMYEKALEIFKKLKIPISLASIYRRKADIYAKTGSYSKALEIYKISLKLYEKSDYILGLGDVHWSLGMTYFSLDENELALKMSEKALDFYRKAGYILGQGNIYINLGDFHLSNGDYSKALEMYNEALCCFEKCEEPMGQGNVYQTKGYIYFKNGKIRNSLELLEKSLILYESIGDIESASFTLYLKAMVLDKIGRKNEALLLFEESLALIEKVQSQTPLSEMKMSFMGKIYNQYKEAVLFMLKKNYFNKGCQYAESMKARVFLDQMSEGLSGLEEGLKPELKEERERLVGKLSVLSRQMQETGGKDEKKLLELKEEYRKVESEFDDLLIKIRLENPLYASVNYPQPISVQDLQKEILKEGETMLSYFISQDETYAFVISKNNFHVQPLKIKEKEVNSSVERYLLAIKGNNANDTKRYGSLLYEKLFKPLEKHLEKTGDIIIVPAGQLETIPFESLIIDNKKPGPPVYLLEKYRLKYVQSATLLSILRKNYNGDNTTKGFIGFGDPVYDYGNFKQGKPEQGTATKAPRHQELFYNNIFGVPSCLRAFVAVSNTTEKAEDIVDEIKEIHRDRFARAGGVMDRLPQSGEEIQSIAQLFEKESLATKIYLRDQAAEENARADNMKDFAYIHFSCHGLLNDDFQCLVLSQLPGSKEDGYFTLNEIMNCDYNAKLIVLSACQTGLGKMARGEGITGLTRAFMYAGSPAVVASLWDVDDAATKELMVKFYSNMLEKNLDKVEALRQAKLELLKNEKYSSPLYWSAFVMYGE